MIEDVSPSSSRHGRIGFAIGVGLVLLFWLLVSTWRNFPVYSLRGYLICPIISPVGADNGILDGCTNIKVWLLFFGIILGSGSICALIGYIFGKTVNK